MGRRIAYGGILTALCVVLIYAAAFVPSGKLGIYALSSLVVAIAVVELDIKLGILVYAASSLLIFLLTGNINALLIFGMFFGSYPLLKYYIERSRNPVIEMVLKTGTFTTLLSLGYLIYVFIFGISPLAISPTGLMQVGLVLAAIAAFFVYDYILSRLIAYYIQRLRSVNFRR